MSARRIWIKYLTDVHASSRLPEDDSHYIHSDFTAQLLALITPRLDHSIKTFTKDWRLIRRLLVKAQERYTYLTRLQHHQHQQQKSQDTRPPPPPIRIMVLGGSVALGIQCRTANVPYDEMNTRYCAWPHRLQTMMNQFFGVGTLIEISNEAVGGTYSTIGTSILKYDLLPGILQDYDIIIHAYSTNDSPHHVSTASSSSSSSLTTSANHYLATLQEFCRLVFQPPRRQQPPQCQSRTKTTKKTNRPLLIHIDDVLTPYQVPLVKYSAMPRVVSSLANHYGFISLSYVDMVRDIVYGDPKETWFSANEFPQNYENDKDNDENGEPSAYRLNVHPGQGMHIATSWMVAFSLLQVTSTFCTLNNEFWKPSLLQVQPEGATTTTDEEEQDDSMQDEDEYEKTMEERASRSYMFLTEYDATVVHQLIRLRLNGSDPSSEGIPPRLPPPQGLLPELDANITLNDLHAQWKAETKQMQLAQNRPCPRGREFDSVPTCPFAWVSGLDQTKNMSWVEENLLSRLVVPPGSNSTSWTLDLRFNFRKLGLIPPFGQVGATMNLDFPIHHGPIATVVIYYLQSYGTTWKDSRARIEIFQSRQQSQVVTEEENQQWDLLVKTELVGMHSRPTSEMYLKEIDLGITAATTTTEDDPRGITNNRGTLRVQATLVDGQTFKIMGLALCHT
jgi:hypothetical protein